MTSRQFYPGAMRAMHWIGGFAVVAAFALGVLQEDASASRPVLLRAHLVVGIVILATTIIRLIVRARSQQPEPLPMPPFRRMVLRVVHGAMYATLLLLGISGVGTAVAGGLGPLLLGTASTVPDLDGVVPAAVHTALPLVFLGAVAAHVAGVMAYQVRDGDALGRMLGRPVPSGSRSERKNG